MKKQRIATMLFLLPLLIVFLLAVGGIFLNTWVYVILSIFCPLAAGATWYLYKDMEKKLSNTELDFKNQ